MDRIYAENIKLMRYDCISEALNRREDDPRSLKAILEEASHRGVVDRNDGERKYFAVPTILRWYRKYKHSGFDGLGVKQRDDINTFHKIDTELYGQIETLKQEYPRITATGIRRKLISCGIITEKQVSLSTITRCVNRIATEKELPESGKKEMKRYEKAHINELWCGDSSTGLYIRENGVKRKLWIQALIDDASRFIVGINVFYQDTYENFMTVIKSAVAKYGVPQMFNFDNGSPYKNLQMQSLAARIGSRIHYNRPYTPTGKAKIERFFKTLKSQWLATFDASKCKSIEDVREDLFKYVNNYNNTVHSSLNNKTPQNRFFEEAILIRKLSESDLETKFLYEIQRKVSKDGVVSINNQMFEVDFKYQRQTITLRYSLDYKEFYVVDNDKVTPIKMLNKVENSSIPRKFYYSDANASENNDVSHTPLKDSSGVSGKDTGNSSGVSGKDTGNSSGVSGKDTGSSSDVSSKESQQV